MEAQTYRLLEAKLVEAEEIFCPQVKFGTRALEIRDDLTRLLGKVVCERIRAEAAEGHNALTNEQSL